MKEFFRGITLSAWAVVAALAFILIVVGWCTYDANRDRRDYEARIQANAAASQQDTSAREAAADERLADAGATSTLKENLTDAVAPLPDARPSDRRRALACARLRADPRADQTAVSAQCGSTS